MITISPLATPKELYYSMYHDYRHFMRRNLTLIMQNPDYAHGVLIDKLLSTTRRYIKANNVTIKTRDRLYIWIMAQYRKSICQ